MIKSLIIAFFLSFSCFGMGSKRPPGIPKPPETEIATVPTPEIQTGETFQVSFIPLPGFATDKQADLIAKASFKLNQTVKSSCFSTFLTAATLKQTAGRTNAQVLAHLLSLNDTVQVKMYYRAWGCRIGCTSAIAYRTPPEKKINLNSAYFTEKRSACTWAATMAHESLGHSLGNYDHSSNWTISREYTVPYKIGGASKKYDSNAFEVCCQD
jgi:hypothetical protein